MSRRLPGALLAAHLLGWAGYIAAPAGWTLVRSDARLREQIEDDVQRLRAPLPWRRPCDDLRFTEALRSCMQGLGRCEVDVLEPTP